MSNQSVLADHVKSERKRISDNILKSYSNIGDVTTPTIDIEKFNEQYFEKSEQFSVISDVVMKSYVSELIETINETEGQEAKIELLEKAKIDIQLYRKFNVQPEKGDAIVFYVKDKIEKGEDYSKWTAKQHEDRAKEYEKLGDKDFSKTSFNGNNQRYKKWRASNKNYIEMNKHKDLAKQKSQKQD